MSSEDTAELATQPVGGASGDAPTADGGPRLMIKKMVLENFKSYAGEVQIGPFDKSMTSVIGPNGSGKSNVIDAMLFVFGFAARNMRQSNITDLIHKSEAFPNLEWAKVSVHFQQIVDQPDGSFVAVEGSELVVQREVRRKAGAGKNGKDTGESIYRMNNKGSSWGEVRERLSGYGIDLAHNRFLILQGEVEQISMMKPKAQTAHETGLLEYLEDIIGSNRLVEKINEAKKSMEELNELRASKCTALKSAEQQVQAQEERKAEAEAYQTAEAALHQKRSALFQKGVATAHAKGEQVKVRARTRVIGRVSTSHEETHHGAQAGVWMFLFSHQG